MPTFTIGADSSNYTSIPANTTPYNIGTPVTISALIVETITLDLGTTGVTSPATAAAAIWDNGAGKGLVARSANASLTGGNTYRDFEMGSDNDGDTFLDGVYLPAGTYYFGVSRTSASYRISVGQSSTTTGVSRSSGEQAPSNPALGTQNNSMSSRRLTGYVTYRDATVPDQPTFTLTEGYGSIAITDISTYSDPALRGLQWQIYRSPGAASWTNITLASGNPIDDGDGTYTITGLTAGTSYDIYLRVYNSHGVSTQSDVDSSTPYGLPFMLSYDAVYDEVEDYVLVSFDADDNSAPSGVDWYHIYRSANGGAFTYVKQTDATETLNGEYLDYNVLLGNSYNYRIYPHNDAGYGSYGETGGVPVIDNPGPVGNLNASNITADSITVTWTAPLNNGGSAIDYYTITLDAEPVFTVEQNVFTATITGLTANTPYTVGVFATNTVLDGEETTLDITTLGGLPRIYDESTGTWLYGTIKHYDDILNQWRGITIKYYSEFDEAWTTYNS